MNLTNAVCVVTGAARGIGLSLAKALLAADASVVLTDVDGPGLERAVGLLASPQARGLHADVTSGRSLAELTTEVEATVGPIAVWINNAGLARHHPIVEYTEADIDLMLAVNLKGAILGSQSALRVMASRDAGHIVNVISTAGLRGVPTETVYCAAKWGVRGFTQGLREEAAPHGIRVTAVLPGGVDTDFWKAAVPGRQLPVHDFLRPAQVAEAIVALLRLPDSVVPQELVLRAMNDRDFAR
jgi:NAD(P)-dependent dehydrogenase (short-subunit alcohol dehydrogenase family)